MRFLSKFFVFIAWIFGAISGIFFPLLLILSSLLVDTNEGNRLVQQTGFPFILICLFLAACTCILGLIFYTFTKKRKAAWILILISTGLFLLAAIGISVITMNASGALSMKVTGEYRMTIGKLLFRHGTCLLIPLFLFFSHLCEQKQQDQELFEETINDLKNNKTETIN